ncbi:MAG TPA: flagellar hook capping FlgD N-terminal domain-containing protein [Methylomirabilota bacterium]|jgi:flagellar basal-body rod modification protein FlgD|nr:flagellar hook capping FlgD N-terminal domain-containing protein [Methylomirabilota bacterium]
MDSSALGSLSQAQTTTEDLTTKARPAKKELDQADFLRLLTTQLQFQDPLKPIDNQEFTAQLTSFNSLDQLVAINKNMQSLQNEQLALTQLQAASLIGKEVSLQGNHIQLGADGKASIPLQLAGDAGRVSVHVIDGEGNTIRTMEAGALKAGEQQVLWDGRDDKGKAAPQGQYTIEVDAFDAQGKKVDVLTLVKGLVSSVDLTGSEVSVSINGVRAPLRDLLSVHAPSNS